ncbi:Ima1 N-terminal domain-containing protein [Cercophora newfieldiana]|uniref:Ima1 N-terminal domain-containing protein n=1 Tax=Cercophora newfieldiana TaxID=92897 RepID=A0AA40CU74_9PEZI|nr:Ima1 N-terminal domain-containing protein [Cercophora newfieldiana]
MPRLNRTRYLSCFYCGRKTSTPNDGKTRSFECTSCEATNYLDKDGQITDPPVATDAVATPAKFAVSRTAQSPPSSPTGAIFCDTCLTNQHLLRASLAQYLPEPDDPEYEQREKDFYRFRNAQEKRYPQICAACEPKVRERLEQAAYTAKTDVLRRMIDRSAGNRHSKTPGGPLNLVSTAGWMLWISGLVLQLCWHVSVLETLFLESDEVLQTKDDQQFIANILALAAPILGILPEADRLIRWSTLATLLSAWWNPRFAQVFRGFTKHINGISKWYVYQVLAVAIRLSLQKFSVLTEPDPSLLKTQCVGHLVAAGFAILIFVLAPRSIRIDMAPLFKPSPPIILRDHLEHQSQPKVPSPSKLDETKSISELLDEISRSPPSTRSRSPSPISDQGSPFRAHKPRPRPQVQQYPPTTSNGFDFDDLTITPHQAPPQYGEEMDWSPTQSKHRAFNTVGQRQTTGFNESPVSPDRGPFWYRVPPAPTSPAQRATANMANQPWLRRGPAAQRPPLPPFGGASRAGRTVGTTGAERASTRENDPESETRYRASGVNFREARFFPPASNDDPRNSLLDMFGQNLSFSEEERKREEARSTGWFGFGTR